MRNSTACSRQWSYLVAGACAIVAGCFALDSACVVFAAPPAITVTDHPFDPDWPHVVMMLAEKCTGCHRTGTDRADFTTYASLMQAEESGTRIIAPEAPDSSLMWEYVSWNADARPGAPLADEPMMPPDHTEWLTSGQQEILHRWIKNGALQYQLPNRCNIRPLMEIDYPSARQCVMCHPTQYEQWSRSMHAHTQHSPIFEAFNLTLVERTAGTIGTFCSRCHTPIGTALGENESVRNVHRSRISREGITCIVCHRRSSGHFKASGRVAIEPVAPGALATACMYGPFEHPVSGKVGAHRGHQLPYIKSSQFCGECHDVTSPNGVRLEEAFSEWQNSPAAKDRTTCQHCHMGPVQGIAIPNDCRPLGRAARVPGVAPKEMPLRRLTDHTFAGPDYSLLPDTEFPYKLDWMYEVDYRDTARLTPYQHRTLSELRSRNRRALRKADEKRYELLSHSARLHVDAPSTAVAGQTIRLRADVTSTVSGHSFPTGFTAERQLWVAVELTSPQGDQISVSGDLDKNGDLRDEHSYAVLSGHERPDRLLLNFQNKFVALTNKGTDRSVVLSVNRHLSPTTVIRPATGVAAFYGRPASFRIAKGSLPPLRTMGQTYAIRLPDCAGTYLLDVRLNFRHLPPALLDRIGTPHLKHLLEIVVIDQFEALIIVTDG